MKLEVCVFLISTVPRWVEGFAPTTAFAPRAVFREQRPSVGLVKMFEVIKADKIVDDYFDYSKGGVELAENSAIKIVGDVRHTKKSQGGFRDVAVAKALERYTKVTEVSDGEAQELMAKYGVTLICTGIGKELYRDPGETTKFDVTLAPLDAVRNALSSTPNASVSSAKAIAFNFVGGDELIIQEVMEAAAQLVDGLDLTDQTKVAFNSLSHQSFPVDTCTVTALAWVGLGNIDDGLSGVPKSAAHGELYFSQGKWWTVVKEDLNDAIE